MKHGKIDLIKNKTFLCGFYISYMILESFFFNIASHNHKILMLGLQLARESRVKSLELGQHSVTGTKYNHRRG